MKLCPTCDQPVAEEIAVCPSCGGEVGEGRKFIDDYRIIDVLHEGHASLLCRAIRERTSEQVMIRLFTAQSGVNDEVAARLKSELTELRRLPPEGFVQHYAIRHSSDGYWYRISEWIEAENWGSLLATGRLRDQRLLLELFLETASILAVLHQQGHIIPHLILNDIIAVKDEAEDLRIKIDYKLSRFFDPKLDQPGPMLKKLLTCHPDIVNQRPLDFRSDIWSLGKIFVELLTADLEVGDYLAKVDELEIHADLEVLLKVMLADDPDLRPQSMTEVAQSLSRIKSEVDKMPVQDYIKTPIAPIPMIRILQKRIRLLAAIVILLIIAGIFSWFQLGSRETDTASALEKYANDYAPSVAFVVAEYWLQGDGVLYYRNSAEGTAFLVDREGYLLTSRHVVCPWLEDQRFMTTAAGLRQSQVTPDFGYRLYLWFEGEKAFNRTARLFEGADISDFYFVDTAYSSETKPHLSIAGVAKPPSQTRQLVASPLKDDFAVLKVDSVPKTLIPLPLAMGLDPRNIPKLSRIIALGFPLGHQSQADAVNVSVSSGHVRRSFENLIQVDVSLHSGNSGGPIIDVNGHVIGIVAGVALDWSQGVVPIATPLWDMGMVLPITKAEKLLAELKTGQVKWNGVLDFTIPKTLKAIMATAFRGQWAKAVALAEEALARSFQPELLMASGMMHFCANDNEGAQKRFTQLLNMDPEASQARLMLKIINRLVKSIPEKIAEDDLQNIDWRSPAEFQGYLARVLAGLVDEDSALNAWYSMAERSWLYYISGLLRFMDQEIDHAENLLQESVLAAEPDTWEFFLARARLEMIQKQRRDAFITAKQRDEYRAAIEVFNQEVLSNQTAQRNRNEKIAPLLGKLVYAGGSLAEKVTVLEQILELDSQNRNIPAVLGFYKAANEDWPGSLEDIHRFRAYNGRQTAVRMSLGLVEAGILNYQGLREKAQAHLEEYAGRISDAWYADICEFMLGKQTEASLKKKAVEKPENLLTAFAILGFWAESNGDKDKAIGYYKLALESFLDTWLEFDFALERLKRLRQT